MRIGLIPNPAKDIGFTYTRKMISLINKHGGTAVINDEYFEKLSDLTDFVEFSDYVKLDLIISLGGDGTFLSAFHRTYKLHVPIIGVNLGSVGFLAEICPSEIENAIDRIFAGDYEIEKRMMLETVCKSSDGISKGKAVSLNDVVVSRSGTSRILSISLYIDDIFVEKLPGDGVIVSTPTGSTAYSLSAGGPIIQPDLHMILITPLNPHTLHNRCYIAGIDSKIDIVIEDCPDNPLLSSDGFSVCTPKQSDIVTVKKSKNHMHFIRLDKSNFYESLTKKIYARGK